MIYERIVQFAARLLENHQRQEVATEAEFQGTVGEAHARTWQIIGKLIENAFFRAILPGFDEVVGIGRKRPATSRSQAS